MCAFLASACTCTSEANFSFVVTLVDADTNAEICDATVVASQDGTDTTLSLINVFSGSCSYSGIEEQEGVFDIVATHPDYEDATFSVDVGGDICHVETEFVEVSLTPAP